MKLDEATAELQSMDQLITAKRNPSKLLAPELKAKYKYQVTTTSTERRRDSHEYKHL
jgi:hypothetical protein